MSKQRIQLLNMLRVKISEESREKSAKIMGRDASSMANYYYRCEVKNHTEGESGTIGGSIRPLMIFRDNVAHRELFMALDDIYNDMPEDERNKITVSGTRESLAKAKPAKCGLKAWGYLCTYNIPYPCERWNSVTSKYEDVSSVGMVVLGWPDQYDSNGNVVEEGDGETKSMVFERMMSKLKVGDRAVYRRKPISTLHAEDDFLTD